MGQPALKRPTTIETPPSEHKGIQLSAAQGRFIGSKAKHPCFCGGYGSGKTFAGILRTLKLKQEAGKLPVAYYLPTYDLVRTIAYPRFTEMLEALRWPYSLNRGDNVINIPDYGQVIFRTMDTPERIVGYEVADSVADELDTLKLDDAEEVWRKILARNRAKKPNGKPNTAACVTTPEGFRFTYKRWQKKANINYILYRASTFSNRRNIPVDYIESLQDDYPEAILRAYLGGHFVNMASGSVYHNFNRVHAHAPVEIKKGEVLHVGMDFNVGNMTAIVSVIRDDKPKTTNELTGVLDTPAMARKIKERWPDHQVVVYPDASGASRKSNNAQTSDLAILRQPEFGFIVKAKKSNPRVKNRVASVVKMIPDWEINTDNCPTLTESLEQQAYDKDGEPDKKSGHDHSTEAAGYFIDYRWPIIRRVAHVKSLRI